jgi:hypothetical protein
MPEQIFELPEDNTIFKLKIFGNVKWSDTDMHLFAEWCSENGWKYYKLQKIWVKYVEVNFTSELTTAQLLQDFKDWKEGKNEKSVI